jgi:hypothetical protein
MASNQSIATYLIISVVLFTLMLIHLFQAFPLTTDKFAFFLVSLFTTVMLIPMLKYLKFFDLIELRKEYKELQRAKR